MNADILFMLGGGFITLLVLVFALMPGQESKTLDKRLRRIIGEESVEKTEGKEEKIQLRRQVVDSGIPFLDHIIKAMMPNPDRLRQRLASTGTPMKISEYLLITMLAVCVAFLLFHLIFGLKLAPSVLLAIMLGLGLPHMMVGGMIKKRCKNFIKFFPESIDAMVRGIRSGLPIIESIKVVGQEMPDPIGIEFRTIADSVRMGRGMEEAMWDVAKRIDVPEFRYLIIALSIQKETGGNLAETLANVAEVLRKRRQLKLKIKAMSSEAKASSMILGALPFLVTGVLSAIASDYVMMLFNDPRGNVLLGIAIGMLGTGIFIMSQMINFEI